MVVFFFFKQKTAYEIGTGDWSSDVCSSDLKNNPRENPNSRLQTISPRATMPPILRMPPKKAKSDRKSVV